MSTTIQDIVAGSIQLEQNLCISEDKEKEKAAHRDGLCVPF